NLAWASGTNATGGTLDTSISRSAAGVVRIGTTINTSNGSLLLANLTASGTVTVGLGGTAITKVLSATATLDFASISGGAFEDKTI
ncbi:hypothetical protein ACI3PL_25710, partial [Lacticaseibacillus paracasei]